MLIEMEDVENKGVECIGHCRHAVILLNMCLAGGWCMVL